MNLIIQHYFMKQHFLSYLIALLLFPLYEMQAAYQPEFSTAGFYELANSGREVNNFQDHAQTRLKKDETIVLELSGETIEVGPISLAPDENCILPFNMD